PQVYPSPPPHHTPQISPLSLHDALPISASPLNENMNMSASRYVVGIDLGTTNSALAYVDTGRGADDALEQISIPQVVHPGTVEEDRKSTRLNSSHVAISYAVFCLKKKNA